MPIQIKCANPDCGQTLTCPDELLGKQVKCPNCATVLKVPGGDDPSSQTDTPPPTDPEAGIDTVTSRPQKSAPEDSTKPQKANTRLGRYTIKGKLGQGGMGRCIVRTILSSGAMWSVPLPILLRSSTGKGSWTVSTYRHTSIPIYPSAPFAGRRQTGRESKKR